MINAQWTMHNGQGPSGAGGGVGGYAPGGAGVFAGQGHAGVSGQL